MPAPTCLCLGSCAQKCNCWAVYVFPDLAALALVCTKACSLLTRAFSRSVTLPGSIGDLLGTPWKEVKADSTVCHLDISVSGSSRTAWLAESPRTLAEFECVFVFSNCLPQP